MSSRINYSNHAAVMVDFVLECYNAAVGAGVKITASDGGKRDPTPDEAAIDFIVTWISDHENEQGSLLKLCRMYALNWGTLHAWIRKDAERNRLYQQAMADRKLARLEFVLDGWMDTAAMPVEKSAEHLDVHRARESIAKAEGMFKPDGAVKGSITITFDDVDARA